MNKGEKIARLPLDDHSGEEEWCSICGDDNIALVVSGGNINRGTNCYYCGNKVVLCSKHAGQMADEMSALNLGLLSDKNGPTPRQKADGLVTLKDGCVVSSQINEPLTGTFALVRVDPGIHSAHNASLSGRGGAPTTK